MWRTKKAAPGHLLLYLHFRDYLNLKIFHPLLFGSIVCSILIFVGQEGALKYSSFWRLASGAKKLLERGEVDICRKGGLVEIFAISSISPPHHHMYLLYHKYHNVSVGYDSSCLAGSNPLSLI